jgi:hypothetical protein
VGNRGEHEASIFGIIPRFDLNFEDEIPFKEGRVVTPAFWQNACVKMWDRLWVVFAGNKIKFSYPNSRSMDIIVVEFILC